MLFIIAIACAVLFVYTCGDLLKKHPYVFYAGAVIITFVVFKGNFSGLPSWVNRFVIGIFSKGAFGTALFVIVMYTGAFKNGTKLIARLMKIRGELSIFAAILVLSHNLTYGKIYFRMLFTKPEVLPVNQRIAAVISLILILIMLVLTITSFPQIRRKMKAKRWKQLQRTAYLFYGLIYIHVMLINIPFAKRGADGYFLNVFVYSAVFLGYAAMRIRKYILMKNRAVAVKNSKLIKHTAVTSAILWLILVVTVSAVALPERAQASGTHEMVQNSNNETGEEMTSAPVREPVPETEKNTGTAAETKEIESITEKEMNTETEADPETEPGTTDETEKIDEPESSEAAKKPQEPETETVRNYRADGEYTGTAVCDIYGYIVEVKITIADDRISGVSITADASDLDYEYADTAINGLKNVLVSEQGHAGLDAVSGATFSSQAIFAAFDTAVNQAK